MAVVALNFVLLVLAYSGGGGEGGSGQSCDAIDVCNVQWPGQPANSCPPGMTKVAPPERSSVYALTSPSESYAPGELIELHLRVTSRTIQKRLDAGVRQCVCDKTATGCDDVLGYLSCGTTYADGTMTATEPYLESAKYIGLLLYAVSEGDAAETKVGRWEIAAELPARFKAPPDPGCDDRALMHASANAKNYFHRFTFRAPAAGAGTLVFRCLIKQGDTNGGAFYWPGSGAAPSAGMAGGDLQIPESTSASPARLWFRAAPFESCSAACAGHALDCDEPALVAASSSLELPPEVSRHFLCQRPLLRSCDSTLIDPALFLGHRLITDSRHLRRAASE